MAVSDVEYTVRVLSCMCNSVVEFEDGSYSKDQERFNLEDLLRTMKRRKQGIDKSKLRTLLSNLVIKDFLRIIEGKKQFKPQSKGEYEVTNEGKAWLMEYQKMINPISGIKKEND